MSLATGKQRPGLSSHKTFVAFNNFLIFGLHHNCWLCPFSTMAKSISLSLSTPPSWEAPRTEGPGVYCHSEGLAGHSGEWKEMEAWGKWHCLLILRIINTWFFSTLGKQRPAPQTDLHGHVVPSPATSREPAEVSSWAWVFVKPLLLAADRNPQDESDSASLLLFASPHPGWASAGGPEETG